MMTMEEIHKALIKSKKPIEYWVKKADMTYWVLHRIYKGRAKNITISNYHKIVKAIEAEA